MSQRVIWDKQNLSIEKHEPSVSSVEHPGFVDKMAAHFNECDYFQEEVFWSILITI